MCVCVCGRIIHLSVGKFRGLHLGKMKGKEKLQLGGDTSAGGGGEILLRQILYAKGK